jgi:hypothetical protein
MDQRIVIRHLNASKANQTDEFPARDSLEILAGREAECKTRYDSDRDDLVSRRHARILVERTDPIEIAVFDLESSNRLSRMPAIAHRRSRRNEWVRPPAGLGEGGRASLSSWQSF